MENEYMNVCVNAKPNTIILQSKPDEVTGGYADKDGVWHNFGGGGTVEHFLQAEESFGTATVDENNGLGVRTALDTQDANKLYIAFCETATSYKIILLYKRGNGNVSVSTGFASDYGKTVYNSSTFTDAGLHPGDVYYLFKGINF